jgi:hypothetical protein
MRATRSRCPTTGRSARVWAWCALGDDGWPPVLAGPRGCDSDTATATTTALAADAAETGGYDNRNTWGTATSACDAVVAVPPSLVVVVSVFLRGIRGKAVAVAVAVPAAAVPSDAFHEIRGPQTPNVAVSIQTGPLPSRADSSRSYPPCIIFPQHSPTSIPNGRVRAREITEARRRPADRAAEVSLTSMASAKG